MAEGLSLFRADMDKIIQRTETDHISSKAQRYLQAYDVGLPQDITVRWFAQDDIAGMEARVVDLTGRGLEVWVSQGLPYNPEIAHQLTSVEKKTDLLKGLRSLEDFRVRALPRLALWDRGSWVKMFYDTPHRALISGTIRFDTSRSDFVQGVDTRTIRLEAAAGISDVRDLDRQMSAKQVVVVHADGEVVKQISQALTVFDYPVIGFTDVPHALPAILEIVHRSKSQNDPRAKPSEPKVVIVDCTRERERGLALINSLRNDRDATVIPIIPIVEDEQHFPAELHAMVTTFTTFPISHEDLCRNVFLTGFRLVGGPTGFQFPRLGRELQFSLNSLLKTIFGPGYAYLRMMVQIANAEQRPTIAFEFKLVPTDPYDFFFLDYEWSGIKSALHRFDWAYNVGEG